jgi:N-acetylmuramoyl-L-alanine amidase
MKHKLVTFIIFTFCTLLLVPLSAISADTSTKQKTIIIDPWYGGKESGPFIAQKKYGKNITLEIAQKLQGLLDVAEFNVYLTRSEDKFVTLENRLFQGKSNGADIHLAVKVSKANKGCVQILFPSLPISKPQTTSKTTKTEELGPLLDKIYNDLKIDDTIEESIFLANIVSKKFKKSSRDCVELRKGKDYLLKNTQLPTILVDFRISSNSKPFPIDDASLDKVAASLADAVKEYFREHTKNRNVN